MAGLPLSRSDASEDVVKRFCVLATARRVSLRYHTADNAVSTWSTLCIVRFDASVSMVFETLDLAAL